MSKEKDLLRKILANTELIMNHLNIAKKPPVKKDAKKTLVKNSKPKLVSKKK